MVRLQLIVVLIVLIVSGCKRHRKIDVEGVISHTGTGQPVSNVKVVLYSDIKSSGKSSVDSRTYETYTDDNGHYKFPDAFFSKPNFKGEISVDDPRFLNECCSRPQIDINDAKWLGQSKATRNYEVTCLSELNTTLVINTPGYYSSACYLKYEGERPVKNFVDFMSVGKPAFLVGYSNGKNIIKTVVKDSQGSVLKTQFDTLVSGGCGTVSDYTLTVN